MDGKTHILTGGITGVFLPEILRGFQIQVDDSILSRLRYGLLGAFGGKLPDIIEPPTSPQHREFFHSVSLGGAALQGARNNINLDVNPNFVAIVAGYLSHLLLDSLTESGLPVI